MRIVRKGYFFLISFGLLMLTINLASNSYVYGEEGTDSFSVTDFNDFEVITDSDYIQTKNYGDKFNLYYNGSGFEIQGESCCLQFEGAYRKFNVEIYFDYNYTGMWFGHYYFFLKSLYNESGYLLETTDGTIYCRTTIADMWLYSGGVFTAAASPFDLIDSTQTAYGSLGFSGTVKFVITKNEDTVTVSIIKNDIVLLNRVWTSGLTRPVNQISLSGYFYNKVDYSDVGDFNLTARNLTGIFTDKELGITTIQLPGYVFHIGIAGLLLASIYGYIVRKKRK